MTRLRVWLPVAAWCAIIFAASAQPSLGQGGGAGVNFWIAKAGHLLEYAVLWRLCRRAFAHDLPPRAAAWAALAFCLAYGAGDEWHQTFVPYREGRPRDVLIDAAGAALSWGLYCRFVK